MERVGDKEQETKCGQCLHIFCCEGRKKKRISAGGGYGIRRELFIYKRYLELIHMSGLTGQQTEKK